MPEIGTSGSMSEDGKRSVAKWPKLPRLSSTLPNRTCRGGLPLVRFRGQSGHGPGMAQRLPMTPLRTLESFSRCPAGHCRHKALSRRLVRCERVSIDRGSKSRRQHKLSSHELQWLREQAYIRFQKSVELAGIANGDARA